MVMSTEVIQLIVVLVTVLAGGSGIAGIIVAISTRKKYKAEAVKSGADATKVIEEAAGSLVDHYRRDNEAVRQECSELKKEVESLTCRLDNDMEECRLEIKNLQIEVETLKRKNGKLIEALNRLIWQIKSRGDEPVIKPDSDWAE
jgi:predicted RNase H-like nuclease (RuvC/YqgF family)